MSHQPNHLENILASNKEFLLVFQDDFVPLNRRQDEGSGLWWRAINVDIGNEPVLLRRGTGQTRGRPTSRSVIWTSVERMPLEFREICTLLLLLSLLLFIVFQPETRRRAVISQLFWVPWRTSLTSTTFWLQATSPHPPVTGQDLVLLDLDLENPCGHRRIKLLDETRKESSQILSKAILFCPLPGCCRRTLNSRPDQASAIIKGEWQIASAFWPHSQMAILLPRVRNS